MRSYKAAVPTWKTKSVLGFFIKLSGNLERRDKPLLQPRWRLSIWVNSGRLASYINPFLLILIASNDEVI